jgi:hypothetical protein
MDYDTLLNQVIALLQREQRLSYRGLTRRLRLDDETLEDLKEDLISFGQLQRGGLGRHQSCSGDTAEEWRWAWSSEKATTPHLRGHLGAVSRLPPRRPRVRSQGHRGERSTARAVEPGSRAAHTAFPPRLPCLIHSRERSRPEPTHQGRHATSRRLETSVLVQHSTRMEEACGQCSRG